MTRRIRRWINDNKKVAVDIVPKSNLIYIYVYAYKSHELKKHLYRDVIIDKRQVSSIQWMRMVASQYSNVVHDSRRHGSSMILKLKVTRVMSCLD